MPSFQPKVVSVDRFLWQVITGIFNVREHQFGTVDLVFCQYFPAKVFPEGILEFPPPG